VISLNCGSGQRPFAKPFINFDIQAEVMKDGKLYHPDLVASMFDMPFKSESVDYVVSHHTLEHLGLGEYDEFLRESHRVLKDGGSLLIFVPDMQALAKRWLLGQITDYIFFVNVYGAYMGSEFDRHRWNWSFDGWRDELKKVEPWRTVKRFDWRPIQGMDAARDWWILGIEAIK
jgi:predicted SAM-dependent methyltransferase